MMPPEIPLGQRATGDELPKSNQIGEDAISHGETDETGIAEPIDRRTIPPAATESAFVASDGHALRRIDWPGSREKVRGSIFFMPGRGDHYEKYLETLEEWHRAGWRVTAADWRGQAGSGRLGEDETTGHVPDFDIWLDDLRSIWSEWKAATPAPHIVAGHSMGGHLVMRAIADGMIDADAVVLSAPMLGMTGPKLPISILHSVARVMTKVGAPTRPAWKWSEKPGEIPAHREKLLSHDTERYADELWWRETRPELVMGPGSWGWVERAYASVRALFAPGVLEAVRTPVFIIATRNDKLVSHAAIEEAHSRLPNSEMLLFGREARHEILREVDAVRDKAMRGIADFLDRKAPPTS